MAAQTCTVIPTAGSRAADVALCSLLLHHRTDDAKQVKLALEVGDFAATLPV